MAEEHQVMAGSGPNTQGQRSGRFLGSLKDALVAASREDTGEGSVKAEGAKGNTIALPPPVPTAVKGATGAAPQKNEAADAPNKVRKDAGLSAAEAARESRGAPQSLADRHVELDRPPTTRVVRDTPNPTDTSGRTQLVRGKLEVKRGAFDTDPVVGWLVIVGGPGIGQYRPVFEGNNTVGRGASNRITLDFGDDAISTDEQAYIRYDSAERSFLFVPNLAKTNVVSINEKRPTGAVELAQMDVITMGRTQLVFVPFCGPEFDWSAIVESKD